VHFVLSSHGFPFATGTGARQPADGLHCEKVHGFVLLALQSSVVPLLHAPCTHTSPVVHALPSSHVLEFGTKEQPEPTLHESSVHGLSSLHVSPLPA
jgi:hypothetical protein